MFPGGFSPGFFINTPRNKPRAYAWGLICNSLVYMA